MIDSVSEMLLQSLEPLDALTHASLTRVAEEVRCERLPPRVKLNASKGTSSLVYVINGSLTVVSEASPPEPIRAGTPRSLKPVFQGTSTELFAFSTVPVDILLLDKAVLEKLQTEENLTGYDVQDVEVNSLESEIFQKVYDACQTGQLTLPSMPEVALQLRNAAQDPNIKVSELSRIIQADPIVAGRIVHAANSPLYRGQRPISGVKDAIVRLGLETSRNLAISLAVKNTFQAKSSFLRARMYALWEHSVQVSSLCYVLARAHPPLDPERALLAGLVHDIGEVPILTYPDFAAEQVASSTLGEALEKLRAVAGVLVLTAWGFDPSIVAVAEAAEDWLRDPSAEADYCDLVVAAQLCVNADTLLHQLSVPPREIAALRKFGLSGEDQHETTQLMDAARNGTAMVTQILQS
nr:HDOD domain-containing protein [Gammaproteobacteria bacterium]